MFSSSLAAVNGAFFSTEPHVIPQYDGVADALAGITTVMATTAATIRVIRRKIIPDSFEKSRKNAATPERRVDVHLVASGS
jgi:hypothetical protein